MQIDIDYKNLKQQLAEIQAELKKLSSEMLELMVLNRVMVEERNKNSSKIEALENDITAFKSGISLIKWVISIFGISMIAFFTYLVSAEMTNRQKLSIQETKIERMQQEIQRLESNLDKLENNYDKTKY